MATTDLPEEAIFAAASKLFRARGLGGTSIRAIAEEAGVLPGSLTYRFPTKESLIVALTERAIDHAVTELRASIAQSHDPIERLRLAMRTHLRVLLAGDDAVYVLVFDWPRLPEETRTKLAHARHRYDALWDGLCFAAAGSGQLASGLDLALLQKFIFGAANSVALWYQPDGPRTPEEIADAFSALIGIGTFATAARPEPTEEMYRSVGAAALEQASARTRSH